MPTFCAVKLLVVEDDENLRTALARMLKNLGFSVLTATDGEDAIDVIEHTGIAVDVLLPDVVMPRLGGRGLAEALCGRDPALKVLFMSGYTDDAVVRGGVEQAAVAFLHKPFAAAALTRKVREVLDQPAAVPA